MHFLSPDQQYQTTEERSRYWPQLRKINHWTLYLSASLRPNSITLSSSLAGYKPARELDSMMEFGLYLPISLRIGPHCFQAGGRKRRPNLGLNCFSLFWVLVILCSWLLCVVVNLVTCVSLVLLYNFEVVSRGFDFCFLSTSQEIGWDEPLGNDLFCVEWDVKPWLSWSPTVLVLS